MQRLGDRRGLFQKLWNGHKIRTQKSRPFLVSGIPVDLYNTDQAKDWGVPFEEDDPCGEVVRTMLAPLEEVNIDDFLTPATQEWCDRQLKAWGFTGTLEGEQLQRPHLYTYLRLRQAVREHCYRLEPEGPVDQAVPCQTSLAHELVVGRLCHSSHYACIYWHACGAAEFSLFFSLASHEYTATNGSLNKGPPRPVTVTKQY